MITRKEFKITVSYIHDAARKGAKYSFDGKKWLNHGEFIEACGSWELLGTLAKDANTRFDEGSDIQLGEIGISVKSSKATLTSVELEGTSMEEMLGDYFRRVASNLWAWGVLIDSETLIYYFMDAETFEKFTMTFANIQRGVIRYKTSSGKMLKWLEEKVEE